MRRAVTLLGFLVVGLAGCGPEQSPDCERYLACQEAVDEQVGTDRASAQQQTYGPAGTCWTTTETAAEACSAACVRSLEENHAAYPDLAACEVDAA